MRPTCEMVEKAVIDGKVGVFIDVEVVPGTRRSCVFGFDEWRKRLMIRLFSPPRAGQANRELIELMAHFLKVRPTDLSIVKGHMSQQKRLLVHELSREDAVKRITEGLLG